MRTIFPLPEWLADRCRITTDASRRLRPLTLCESAPSARPAVTARSATGWRRPTATLLLPLCLLAGCATTPPSSPENLCQIFREKPGWHKQALKVRKKWNIPPQVAMAMMYQESSFRHDAQPPRRYLLGFIPWGRVSTAYGYAQAKDETWADYKREAGSMFASRDNFGDALDFMGWYMDKTQHVNGTSKWDAYAQYLNYHEGWGGYRNGSHKRKAWLLRTAATVQSRAERFGAQYRSCEKSL